MARPHAGRDARTRRGPGKKNLVLMLLPALTVVIVLFGGGLVLGVLQGLGHLPGAGLSRLSGDHFSRVLTDPDFFASFRLTFYVASVSTLLAAVFSVAAALALAQMAARYRLAHFVFQVPLTVPHLVIAVAVMFMLSPSGLLARAAVAAGLIRTPADFPLLVNDRWSIGIILTYVWKEIPFITLMLLAVLRNAGRDLLDVGRTLKAGAWQRFRYIVLPTIFPALGAASLIVFAYTFGAFEVPYLLGRTYPVTLPVWAYKHYSDIDLMSRPEGIATGILIALVVAAAVVTAQVLTRTARKRGIVI
ncbi:MAG: sugar ABC transporter permease [Desulfosarcina sp.]|nr:sugar ABC transporter permease [Desulfobacterales bacterium]